MLPVVASGIVVTLKILQYAYMTVAVSLLLGPFVGWLYAACAAAAGVWFLVQAHRLRSDLQRGRPPRPMKLFHASITYLTVISVAIAVGALI